MQPHLSFLSLSPDQVYPACVRLAVGPRLPPEDCGGDQEEGSFGRGVATGRDAPLHGPLHKLSCALGVVLHHSTHTQGR